MRFWFNLLGYQAVWLAAVLGAARGETWPALAAAALFALVHFGLPGGRRADARLLLCALVAGALMDGGLAASGWLVYSAAIPQWPPLWILAIWAAFALTLDHSLAYLQIHPRLTVLLGAVGGPLAYLGAARLQAVAFVAPDWRAIAALSLAWALALPALTQLARRWHGSGGGATTTLIPPVR
jgi:hypothetical protein